MKPSEWIPMVLGIILSLGLSVCCVVSFVGPGSSSSPATQTGPTAVPTATPIPPPTATPDPPPDLDCEKWEDPRERYQCRAYEETLRAEWEQRNPYLPEGEWGEDVRCYPMLGCE